MNIYIYIYITYAQHFVDDCVWSGWQIGECSETCDEGIRTNTRVKIVEEKRNGTCQGIATVQERCNLKKCPGKNNYVYINREWIK